MTTINFEGAIKATEDYKVGDWLMQIRRDVVYNKIIYKVTSIALDEKTKKYVLIPVSEQPILAAEPMFDTLADMVMWYKDYGVRFVKVNVEMNASLDK